MIEENENVRLNFTYSDDKKEWNSYYLFNTNIFSNSSFLMDFDKNQIIFENIYKIINSVKKEVNTINLISLSKQLLSLLKDLYNYKDNTLEENLKIIKKEFKQSRKENINLIINNIKNGNNLESIYELSFFVQHGRNYLYIKKINNMLENIYFYM